MTAPGGDTWDGRDLAGWMTELRQAPRGCGHTAAQHAGHVRDLIAARQPALAARIGETFARPLPEAVTGFGACETETYPRSGEEHIEAGWA